MRGTKDTERGASNGWLFAFQPQINRVESNFTMFNHSEVADRDKQLTLIPASKQTLAVT